MTVIEQRTMESIQKMERKISEFSLRDYFAGQVLAGMADYVDKDNPNLIAKVCYILADAMIEEKTR